jgi:hypothetical protein
MKNLHPLRTARRKGDRLKKLGCKNPFCLLCLCSNPMLLRSVTRSFLEEHHIFGVANDRETTLALCFNCHALVTESLAQAGVTMTPEPNRIKLASNMFRAFAVHHEHLGKAAGRFADLLNAEEGDSMIVPSHTRAADIIGMLFKLAWPVWKIHRGKVPNAALLQLEQDGDWPRGLAKIIMRRISNDANLRCQLDLRG